MRRALELAEQGRGWVEPNPLVGAVLVRAGRVVGEGYHERFGGPHAEAHALSQAGAAARGAMLYVTLEPCCHHGKTPPCTDALIAAGVRRVVAAMKDPQVGGAGLDRLRQAGLTVHTGVLEDQARQLNAPYLKLITRGVPYVHAKWAMTLDGKIATVTGQSKWITGEQSRRRVHELRGRMDAIIVGIGTVLADDPLLTARPPGPRTASRVVLDSGGRLPPESQLARTARDAPVIVATTDRASAGSLRVLQQAGCECLRLGRSAEGVDLDGLLRELGQRRLTNVLVEGGSAVLGSFFEQRQLDEVYVFVAAKLLGGGARAPSPLGGAGIESMADAFSLEAIELVPVGNDYLIHGRIQQLRSQPL